MSKTNCINCGAAKEANDLQCPFCGTKYIDMATIDLLHDNVLYMQMTRNGQPFTAKAYITNKTLEFHHQYLDCRSVSGELNHLHTGTKISGTIGFTLLESI